MLSLAACGGGGGGSGGGPNVGVPAENASIPFVFETIADIAHCTLTNYTNRLADTAFDDFLEGVSVDAPPPTS